MKRTSGWSAALLAAAAAGSPAIGQIIGADFGGGTTPPNWNAIAGAGAHNLIDDTGAPSGVTLTVAGSVANFARVINAATIPQLGYSLAGLDSYWYGTSAVTATFAGLTPGASYKVWVFGLRAFTMNNRVTIDGGIGPVQFDQRDTIIGNLWVNGTVGSSTQTLDSYAVIQTADGGGQIVITWLQTPGSTSTGWSIAGAAIEAAVAPCYADCDTSTGVGVLDIFDFLCFQNRFAGAAPYACDCDTATGVGVCDIFDFLCFQNAFAAGCP